MCKSQAFTTRDDSYDKLVFRHVKEAGSYSDLSSADCLTGELRRLSFHRLLDSQTSH